MQIPVIFDIDVLVFGATSGAVAAALSIRESGRSVAAVSDRSYFGDETAGTLQLWPALHSRAPLYKAAFHGNNAGCPSPGHIKHVLESALLEKNIPFLYNYRPVFVLRGTNEEITGLVLATRSTLHAVICRVVIDTSHTGVVARLAGLPMSAIVDAKATKELVVVAQDTPQSDDFDWEDTGATFVYQRTEKDKPQSLPAYRLRLPQTKQPVTLAARLGAEHLDRATLHYPGVLYSAETISAVLSDRLVQKSTPSADDPLALPDATFFYCNDRLLVMNGLLPLTSLGAEMLNHMAIQLELGDRLGRLSAACASQLPSVVGRLTACAGSEGTDGQFGFAGSFLRRPDSVRYVDVSISGIPVLDECDVLVAGGGTSGAPAGVAAARAGARTIVVERFHNLGGVGTLGMICSYYMGNRVGFTLEVDDEVNIAGANSERRRSTRWNPEDKAGWYLRALRAAGGSAWLNSFAFGVSRQGSQVTGVLVSTPYGAGLVQAEEVIDASGNADLAAAAGAPCREVGPHHVAVQGAGLSPRRPGMLNMNSDHNFIDDNDPVGVTHAYVNARAKFKSYFDVVPIVDSRERRQIIGDIELSPLDFLAGRTFDDTIVTASSNFDSHGFTVHPVFLVQPPDKTELKAHVPFRCMLPQGLDNVLTTGLSVSAHRDAIPVIRMQADLQNQGYAAGLAAAMAARIGCGLRGLPMRQLQQELVACGCLEPNVLSHKDSFPLPVSTVQEAVERGPIDTFSAAIIFGHLETSIPLLIAKLSAAIEDSQKVDAALVLGLCGRNEGAELLAAAVEESGWDEGWNYKGMSQFGPSMSRMDTLIVALGKTCTPIAVAPVLAKIQALDADSAFSHCRAVSIAAAALADPQLVVALYNLLQKPGIQGHAHLDTSSVIKNANAELNENETRNASLKELILGRGLFLCGDHLGLGRQIMEMYSNDLRGHYARHAQAVLSCPDLHSLRREVW